MLWQGASWVPLHFGVRCGSAAGRGLWALRAVLSVRICQCSHQGPLPNLPLKWLIILTRGLPRQSLQTLHPEQSVFRLIGSCSCQNKHCLSINQQVSPCSSSQGVTSVPDESRPPLATLRCPTRCGSCRPWGPSCQPR